jgi:LPS O-antigen subunit length determinant protein (WzzB/FepE family)
MQSDNATGQITLDAVFRAAWRMRWLMLACIVAGTGLAATAAWIMTPKYRVAAVMIPVKGDDSRSALSSVVGQLGGLASLAGAAFSGGGNKDEYLEYLRSHEFTARFIEDEKLLPVLFAKKWDAAHGRWNVDDPNDVPTLNDGVEYFDRGIRSIQEDRRSGLVTLTILWKDREQAALWANTLVQRVNRDLRQRAIAEADASIAYLNSELAKTSVVELRESLYRLLENQTKTIMFARGRPQYAFKVIDPAYVPDADKFVRPKRLAMILLGALAGLVGGLAMVAFLLRREQLRQ